MSFRIGLIDYLNTQPFQYGLVDALAPAGVRFTHGVPTTLNRALLAGEIDMALISTYFAAEHASQFALLPHHSIASLGAVKTVLLFSWESDIRDLDGLPIALTNHSATSVNLLRVLCRERYGIQPRYEIMAQDLPAMMRRTSAALVIGDTAMVEAYRHRAFVRADGRVGRPVIFDLGDEWLKLTGLPFTFAVWAVRRGAVVSFRNLRIAAVLQACKQAGLAHIDQLAVQYAPKLNIPEGLCRRYLHDLRYNLLPGDRAGLYRFLEMAIPNFDKETLFFLHETQYAGDIYEQVSFGANPAP